MDSKLITKIEALADASGRYRPEAYFWVIRALDFTRHRLQREGHVSGRELLEGFRLMTLEEYGPTSLMVLRHWGLNDTEDVGRIVFQLVEGELLGKTDEDGMNDFSGVYNFEQAFAEAGHW